MKTILVTGASSGIGRALAVRASRAGYAVYAVGRNLKALAALAGQIGEEGGIVATDITDISEPTNAPGLVGRMLGAFGRIDVLVNNAGTVSVGPIASQSDEDLRVQFGTHVIGPLALSREALPSLRASHGHIFMLGSGVARIPVGGLGAYPPSKAALRSATAILRRELAPLEIAVTYVDPGAVDTSFMSRAGMPGAPQSVLVSPELVARKILLAIGTRPRNLNVAPLQTAALTLAELLPGITEAIIERNPSIVGAGATFASLDTAYRSEKMALPSAIVLSDGHETIDNAPTTHEHAQLETLEDLDLEDAAPELTHIDRIEHGIIRDMTAIRETIVPAPIPEPIAETPIEAAPDVAAPEVFVPEVVAPEVDAPEDEIPKSIAIEVEDDGAAQAESSFDAALESLARRMEKAKLDKAFVRTLLVKDNVIDVGETAMRWAGMPNKHERALTSEVFFALAEWGFLAPRADGRYRVILRADESPTM